MCTCPSRRGSVDQNAANSSPLLEVRAVWGVRAQKRPDPHCRLRSRRRRGIGYHRIASETAAVPFVPHQHRGGPTAAPHDDRDGPSTPRARSTAVGRDVDRSTAQSCRAAHVAVCCAGRARALMLAPPEPGPCTPRAGSRRMCYASTSAAQYWRSQCRVNKGPTVPASVRARCRAGCVTHTARPSAHSLIRIIVLQAPQQTSD